ncbi:molybdopterin-synthase adenylyltransferase MoeB [Salinisphaera hydrothermalis]|uniref:Molybdopterin-synthase adenylyltransferase n=1 Tax=Salinisphaera hydrothermalis (strain C41B8) TaxID=1304275 RepID=A0A084IGT6_SALHC|nr:molybdopterin-synthase adenylyltransferase MoeB [Salinisphaera hydrothermalis]KEZ75920.1 molybdopterin biosynthesis protein MoeB [Salinisphaera hydrothermalis C41B8]
MSISVRERLAALREARPPVEPLEAQRLAEAGAWLIDIREADEIAQGTPVGAKPLGRGFLEMRLEREGAAADDTLLLLCASGSRSLLAADQLHQLGYTDVRSVAGGFDGWKDAGLPFEMPPMLDAGDRARYARQLTLPEVGEGGQTKLRDARVLVIGAGGLGSPAALYLAAAGVGHLGIVDHDTVDRSNLHRQILHRDASVGQPKVRSAQATLSALNPAIEIEPIETRVGPDNAAELVAGYDLVVDGSDNFSARYAINDACVGANIALVYGAVERFNGQVGVFPAGGQPCYRCLFAEAPPAGSAPTCAEAGVIGAVPGIVGTIQALEAIKLIVGMPDTLAGKLLSLDVRTQRWRTLSLPGNPHCTVCGTA